MAQPKKEGLIWLHYATLQATNMKNRHLYQQIHLHMVDFYGPCYFTRVYPLWKITLEVIFNNLLPLVPWDVIFGVVVAARIPLKVMIALVCDLGVQWRTNIDLSQRNAIGYHAFFLEFNAKQVCWALLNYKLGIYNLCIYIYVLIW